MNGLDFRWLLVVVCIGVICYLAGRADERHVR